MDDLTRKFSIVVFASGGGGNLRYLIERQVEYDFFISLVVVDRLCGANDVANEARIPVVYIEKLHGSLDYDGLYEKLCLVNTDLIVLAGFMPILPASFIDRYERRIINTHPSLLPAHGGRGMYGVKVHESVIRNGDAKSGCSCHFVDSGVDTGEVICQKSLLVDRSLTAWELGGEVFRLEGPNLVEAIHIIMSGWESSR